MLGKAPTNRVATTKKPSNSSIPIPCKVPDFSSMHKDWEQIQLQRKLKLKKKVTVPKEFQFSSSSASTTSQTYHKPSNARATGGENVDSSNRSSSNGQLKSILKQQNFDSSNSKSRFVPSNITSSSELRRKSLALGPVRRAGETSRAQPTVSSHPNELDSSRRKSLATTLSRGESSVKPQSTQPSVVVNAAAPNSPQKSVPMSKLERRLSTYFSKEQPSKKPVNSLNMTSDPVVQYERIETRLGQTLMEITNTPAKSIKPAPVFMQDDQEWMKQLAQDILKRTEASKSSDDKDNEIVKSSHTVSDNDVSYESVLSLEKPKLIPVKLDPKLISELIPTPPPPIVDKSVPPTEKKPQRTASKTDTTKAEIYQIGYKEQLCDDEDMTFKLPVPKLLVPVDHDAPSEKSYYQLKKSQEKLFQNAIDSPFNMTALKPLSVPKTARGEIDIGEFEVSAANEGTYEQPHDEETCQFYFDTTGSQFEIQNATGDFIVPPTPVAIALPSVKDEFLTPFKTDIDAEELLISSPDAIDQQEIMKQLQSLQLLEEKLMKDLETQSKAN